MKAMRWLTVAAALGATACLSGQTNVVGLLKIQERFTTDGSTTIPHPNGQYSFEAFMNRPSYDGSETVSATVPGLSTGTVEYEFEGDGWAFSKPYSGETAKLDMDAEFENGDYIIDDGSDSITLTLGTFDLYSAAPLFELDNGTFTPFWSGGKLWVDPTQDFKITSGTFTGFVANESMIGINVEGGVLDMSTFTLSDMTQTSTFLNVTAGTFLVGQQYFGAVEFIRWSEVDSATISGVTGLAGFSVITGFEIQAIPEPSTYAAIFGGVALVGVMIVQRRRAITKG